MITNADRARKANDALAGYIVPGDDDGENIQDLLTDLMHWADAHDVDFNEVLVSAQINHEAEK